MPIEVQNLINFLRKKIIKEKNSLIKEKIERRIARLLAKVAVIKVGANSEIELKEKKDRVEDAICATKAAIKEGIVPGGGIALLNAADNINADNLSEEILFNAIKSPYNTILNNAGITNYTNSNVEGEGLNVVTGETVSMVKSGIIDPLLVTKSALRNAASVASTILSTDCVINNLRA
jgi:chaperonin GroEL